MARLPDPSQFERRLPQASGHVAAYRTGMAESALGQLGAEVFDLANKETDRLNSIQAEDALNKLAEKKLELTYGANGFANVRGGQVLSGKITEAFPQQFQSAADEIANGLTNDAQRKLFKAHFAKQLLGFKGDVLRHSINEADKFDDQTMQGTFSVATETAAARWDDPVAIVGAKSNIEDAIDARVASGKLAPDAAQALRLDKLSKMNTAVVMRALQSNRLDYADQYLKEHGQDFDVADLVKTSGLVTTAKKSQLAIGVAGEVMQAALPKLQPSDMDRLVEISKMVPVTKSSESSNRQFDSNGKPLIGWVKKADGSQVEGGIGIMQVTLKTGPEAAKLAGLPWDENRLRNDEKYNEALGTAYLGKQLQTFGGDIAKAWAAYNAGEGNAEKGTGVRGAIKNAEKSAKLAEGDPSIKPMGWLDFMPKETREYVAKNLKAYDGHVAVSVPTLLDLKGQVADRLKGESPDVIAAAQSKVEANYNDWQQDRRQQEDQLLTQVMNQVDAGHIRSLADLNPTLLQSLGDKRVSARSYIESAGRRGDKALEASPVATTAYYEMYTDPVLLKSKSVSDIMSLAPELGQARTSHLLQKRAEYLNRPEKEQAATVDSDQFKALAAKFGFDPNNKEHRAELIQIKDRVEQEVSTIQADKKTSLSREEKGRLISNLMTEYPSVKYLTSGMFDSGFLSVSGTDPKRGYDIKNPENIVIPEKAKAAIQKLAAARGRTLSTPEQWRDAYTAYLQAERGL